MASKLDAQVSVKMSDDLLATLREIESQHGITPPDALRRLGEEMAKFYRQNGWFSFPVFLLPEAEIARRVKPLPLELDIWALDPINPYVITDDTIVRRLLEQLGLPNLFAQAQEHEKVQMLVAFDNHPTHWLEFRFFKGGKSADENGLLFDATPKATVSRKEMIQRLQQAAKKIHADGPVNFSQIPMLKAAKTSNQTATKR